MKTLPLLSMFFYGVIALHTFADAEYPGSQAYNKTQLGHESVNAATGTFDYSYPLILAKGRLSNFQLHLSYRFNKDGMFGLPNGWQVDLDFIKERSAYIHGQEWLIDRLWRDETGFGSGLRYYNLHGTQFIDEGEAREVPGHKGIFYRYKANHKDGSIKFFSHQGLIVVEKDRFGNFIQFDYEKPIAWLKSARLKTLIDNYGNHYTFEYLPGELILTSPDDKKNHVYFNKNGVEAIANALGQPTEFKYVSFAGRNLLRTIQTPKGLMTQISYDTISYQDSNGKQKMPVVGLVEKMDLANNKKIEETHYSYSQDNNFTGYPMYSLSNNGDSLMDSQNKTFRYSVEVSRSDLVGSIPQNKRKIFYYNYLHLPVEVHTLKDGLKYLRTTYEYSISPFKYSRSTNYDKPRETTNWIWDDGQNKYIPSDKILTKYDRYGNKIEEVRQVFDRIASRWKTNHKQVKSYYNEAFGLEKENMRFDEFTGQILLSTYTLSKDRKSHAEKTIEYKENAQSAWQPWQKFNIQHDSFGRKTASKREWLVNGQPGPKKSSYTKEYYFDANTKHLTASLTSNLGAINTEVQDTRNGNLIQKRTPAGSVWQYEYDDLDRLTKETNPLGNATLFTYQDFDKDHINQIIKETPLHYKVATVTDAVGRIIEHKDYFQDNWRRLSATQYNGWNKSVKQTNILGLDTVTIYDQHERPVKHIDYWENIKRIEYNDLHLTTTTFLNQHKVMEKETQPWLGKTLHRKYPIFDNPHDPQTHFLEETVEKNGFGQVVRHTSALIHRHTRTPMDMIESIYTYDPSFNRIKKTIEGVDGLHFTRLTQYDLFNNVVKHIKEQIKDNETTRRVTDLREYNEDNQLISVVTPLKMTTRHINDKEGRRIKTSQPDGKEILYEYNLLGQVVKNSWMRGDKHLEITKSYDEDNQLISLSDNNGQVINYSYLPNGKVHTITYPDQQKMTLDYDDKNRVISRTDFANKRYQFTYNEADNGLVSEIQVDNNQIQFHYGEDDNNIKGNLISRIASYEKAGVTESRFYYGSFKNLTKTTHFNKTTGTVFNTTQHFNARGQLESIANHSHKGHITTSDTLMKYQYDALNRLISETHDENHLIKSIDYRYDANNNLVTEAFHDGTSQHSVSYRYNQQDQRLTSTSGDENRPDVGHYSWDKNGHLEKTPNATVYEYDAQGYLMTIKYPDFKTIEYHYYPNGLLSKRARGEKNQSFYHGINKKITAIMDDDKWYSLYSDTKGLQANFTHDSVDQFFLSGRNSGGITTNNKALKTTNYTAYGKPVTPFNTGNISSSFGWNQEYTDPDAQLTYLQRRFYSPDLKMFISRDTYHVDNHYGYAKANPITFIDPTGHSAQQGLSYGLGGGFTALGIVGAIFAIPTGGASLSLSAGAGITAGAATALSGISLMGSQGALDSGNKQAAKALQYTSIGLGAIAMIEAGVALAPTISARFFAASATNSANLSSSLESSLESSLGASTTESTRSIFSFYEPIDEGLMPSYPIDQLAARLIANTTESFLDSGSQLTRYSSIFSSNDTTIGSYSSLSRLSSIEADLNTLQSYSQAGVAALDPEATPEFLNTPVSLSPISLQDSIHLDIPEATETFDESPYDAMPTQELIHSIYKGLWDLAKLI